MRILLLRGFDIYTALHSTTPHYTALHHTTLSLDGSRPGWGIWTKPHINVTQKKKKLLHHVRQPGTRGGSNREYFRRQYSYETRTANTLTQQVSFLRRTLEISGSGGGRQLDYQARRRRLLPRVVWNVCVERDRQSGM